MPFTLQEMIKRRHKLVAELAALDNEIEMEALRLEKIAGTGHVHTNVEKSIALNGEGSQPQKVNNPKRKRRTEAEMERDVTSAIRYLLDEEYNGATQSGVEQRFGLPARILSKGKWAQMIENYRKMR